jgi:Ca2+-binding RTX toxin-like protein
MTITGTAGDDIIDGASGNDRFDMSQGSDDVVTGEGGFKALTFRAVADTPARRI